MTKSRKEKKNFDQAAAAAKREHRRQLMALITALSPEQRQTIVTERGAITSCTGPALSVYNSCLILHQNPDASVVGGFQQWLALGRVVRKGEKALCIWVPTQRKGEAEDGSDDKISFVGGNVFDISQTDIKDVDEAVSQHLHDCDRETEANIDQYFEALENATDYA